MMIVAHKKHTSKSGKLLHGVALKGHNILLVGAYWCVHTGLDLKAKYKYILYYPA